MMYSVQPSQPELPRLRREAAKFVIAVAVCLSSFFVVVNIPLSWGQDSMPLIFLMLFVPMFTFVCLIVCYLDLAKALRAHARWRFLGLALGLPQFLLGLLCLAMGLAIIACAFYTLFHDVLFYDEPTLGMLKHLGFLAFVFGPLLARCGYAWIKTLFQPHSPEEKDGGKGIA